jgi:hypothetical protein
MSPDTPRKTAFGSSILLPILKFVLIMLYQFRTGIFFSSLVCLFLYFICSYALFDFLLPDLFTSRVIGFGGVCCMDKV